MMSPRHAIVCHHSSLAYTNAAQYRQKTDYLLKDITISVAIIKVPIFYASRVYLLQEVVKEEQRNYGPR